MACVRCSWLGFGHRTFDQVNEVMLTVFPTAFESIEGVERRFSVEKCFSCYCATVYVYVNRESHLGILCYWLLAHARYTTFRKLHPETSTGGKPQR
jgi:sigma54-dependent transcription regulator